MRYERLIRAVYCQPWLITAQAHASIRAIIEARVFRSERPPGEDICGEAVEVDQMTVADGVARIPVAGVIGRKLTAFERGMGAVDTIDIARDIDEALERDDVEALVLDIDSPGGVVDGTPTLADKIAMSRGSKPIVAYTDGLMASAAYWLASGADAVYGTRDSEVGSVGVFLPLLDQSAAFEQGGLHVEMIKSGKFKGAGYPGTSLSEEQRDELQGQVDAIHREFKGHINQFRNVPESAMEGQTFRATDAASIGMLDGLVTGYGEVVDRTLNATLSTL